MSIKENEKKLIVGSFADLLHDFGEIVPKLQLSGNEILRKEIYDALPNKDNPFNNDDKLLITEEEFLNEILPDIGTNFILNTNTVESMQQSMQQSDPMVGFKLGKNKTNPGYYQTLQSIIDLAISTISLTNNTRVDSDPIHGIPVITTKTFNNHEYQIKSRVLINKKNNLLGTIIGNKYEYNDPNTILDQLGIEDKSAFVVDFASVSLSDFLTSNSNTNVPPVEVLKNLFFITNPETENDAAGKMIPTSSFYLKSYGNKIQMHSLLQSASVSNDTLYYHWVDDPSNINSEYQQFFTKYQFHLSELKEKRDGKRIKYSTDLTINNPEDGTSQLIQDSGNASNITFVKKSIFARIKNLFTKKPKTPSESFFINSKFQHKRSGDWLQVLSCLNLKQRQYKFVSTEDLFKDFDSSLITDEYFVTHDRIALGFALYLGLNAVYTHAPTSSYYVFKNTKTMGTPEEKIAKNVWEKIKLIYEVKQIKDVIPYTPENYNDILTRIVKYNEDFEAERIKLETNIQTQLSFIDGYGTTADTITPDFFFDKLSLTAEPIFKQLLISLNIYVTFLTQYKTIDVGSVIQRYQSKRLVIDEILTVEKLFELEAIIQSLPQPYNLVQIIQLLNENRGNFNGIVSSIDEDILKEFIIEHKQHIQSMVQINSIITNGISIPEASHEINSWSLQYTLDNFNISNRDSIDAIQKKLANLPYKHTKSKTNYNPFVSCLDTNISTSLHTPLPELIFQSLNIFLSKLNTNIQKLVLVIPNRFDRSVNSYKKNFIIWEKLISTMMTKINIQPPLQLPPLQLPPPPQTPPPQTHEGGLRTERNIIPHGVITYDNKINLPPYANFSDTVNYNNTKKTVLSSIKPPADETPADETHTLTPAPTAETLSTETLSTKLSDNFINSTIIINEYISYLNTIDDNLDLLDSMYDEYNKRSSAFTLKKSSSTTKKDGKRKSSKHSRRSSSLSSSSSKHKIGGSSSSTLKKSSSSLKKKSLLKKSRKYKLCGGLPSKKKQNVGIRRSGRVTTKPDKYKGIIRKILSEVKLRYMFLNHTYDALNLFLLNDDMTFYLNPSVPLFMMTESLYVYCDSILDKSDIYDDDDLYEDYSHFYVILNELKNYMENHVERLNYGIYGFVLRYWLFTDFYENDPPLTLRIDFSKYKRFFKIRNELVNYISGNIVNTQNFNIFDYSIFHNPDVNSLVIIYTMKLFEIINNSKIDVSIGKKHYNINILIQKLKKLRENF